MVKVFLAVTTGLWSLSLWLPVHGEIAALKIRGREVETKQSDTREIERSLEAKWVSPLHSDYRLMCIKAGYEDLLCGPEECLANTPAVVSFELLPNGVARDIRLQTSSGNQTFDKAAEQDVQAATFPHIKAKIQCQLSVYPQVSNVALAKLIRK